MKILDSRHPAQVAQIDTEDDNVPNERLNHEDIGKKKHNHGNGEDGEIGDNVSEPAAEGVRAGEDVLKKNKRGENDLDDDGDVGFEEFKNKFYNAVTDGNKDDDTDDQTESRNGEKDIKNNREGAW